MTADRHTIITRYVNHDSFCLCKCPRVRVLSSRATRAVISVIAAEIRTRTSGERYASIYSFIYIVKKTHDGCDLAGEIARKKNEMKINYYCLYYCSNVVLFLSSVTKTSEDRRTATDRGCLTPRSASSTDEIGGASDAHAHCSCSLTCDCAACARRARRRTRIARCTRTSDTRTADC